MKLKNSIVLTLLLIFGLQNLVRAMEVAQTKVEETQKSKLERAKEFIKNNPKTAIAIAATTLLVAGGIGLGAHRLKTGRWVWSSPKSTGPQVGTGLPNLPGGMGLNGIIPGESGEGQPSVPQQNVIQPVSLIGRTLIRYLDARGMELRYSVEAALDDIVFAYESKSNKELDDVMPQENLPNTLKNFVCPSSTITYRELMNISRDLYAYNKVKIKGNKDVEFMGVGSYEIEVIDYLIRNPSEIEKAKISLNKAVKEGAISIKNVGNTGTPGTLTKFLKVIIPAVEEALEQ